MQLIVDRDSRISKYKRLIDWLSPLFENIVNSQELNHDVVKIIDELKGNEKRIGSATEFFLIFSYVANGHEIVLFSNIGEEHLEKLVERLPVMVRFKKKEVQIFPNLVIRNRKSNLTDSMRLAKN
jgi:hypothetical protein